MASSNEAQRIHWNDEQWVQIWLKRQLLTKAVTPALFEALDLNTAERVVDIGCGTGTTTMHAAAIVGSEGVAIGVDISVPLAQRASAAAARDRVNNASFQVLDMQTDAVEGGPFDVAMSQFGVMFFDDPDAAFANVRSQLLPGGRFGFACWQDVGRNRWNVAAALTDLVPAPSVDRPGPFSLADPNRIRTLLERAGFADINITPHDLAVQVPQYSLVDDGQLAFMGVAADQMSAARAAVDAHMATLGTPSDPNRFPIAFQIALAHNPDSP
jgi:SAM-dependent methyltransferase